MIRNLKIAPKLALGFAILILSTFAIGIMGISMIRAVDFSHRNTIDYTIQRHTYLTHLEPYIGVGWWSEGLIGSIITSLDEESMIAAYIHAKQQLVEIENRVIETFEQIRNNIIYDIAADEIYQAHRFAQFDELQRLLSEYIVILYPIYDAVIIFDFPTLNEIVPDAIYAWNLLSNKYYLVLEEVAGTAATITGQLSRDIDFMIGGIWVFFIVAIIVDIVIMYFIARSISKPVKM